MVTSTLCSQENQPGSVGAALPGIEIRLVDETGTTPSRATTPARSRSAAPTSSAATGPTGPTAPTPRAGGTGDVGFLDASGDLFLVDRLKELVIVSGFNVYPIEVEDVIGEVDGVVEVAVIGVPDAETGEAVVAYVVACCARWPATSRRRSARTRSSGWRASSSPPRIEVVDELPLTRHRQGPEGPAARDRATPVVGLLE